MEKEKNEKQNNKKHDKEKEELLKIQNENKELQDKNLRLQAEIANIMRRNSEEISKLRKYDGEDIIKNLLNVIDNFERAIKLDDTNLTDELSKFLNGFKMIYGNFVNYLKSIGVSEVEALDMPFDPNTMEAVTVEEVDGVEPGKVIDIYQKGYLYKDKIIRAAMVKVSK